MRSRGVGHLGVATWALALSALLSSCTRAEDAGRGSSSVALRGAQSNGQGVEPSPTPASAQDCPQKGGQMARLKSGPQGSTFCIDHKEVSQGQYAAFLAQRPERPAASPPFCAEAPITPPVIAGHDTPGCPRGVIDFREKRDLPMVCVSWCDALAYCAWAGKRLCGGLGGGGTQRETASDADADEWSAACTSGGKMARAPSGCVLPGGAVAGPGSTVRETECRAEGEGFQFVTDLPGNVMEWTSGCEGIPFGQACLARGGSFREGTRDSACGIATSSPGVSAHVGFRCCADLGG